MQTIIRNGVKYELRENGTAVLKKYEGNDSKVAIPYEVEGHRVTVVGKNAFKDCSSLKEITIPNKAIENCRNAFYGCPSLEVIYLTNKRRGNN